MEKGIEDIESRVRYRVVQAIAADSIMLKNFIPVLDRLKQDDKNEAVRDLAGKVLLDMGQEA
jgi:peptidoglycan biosynthesis protein MviN/MurJ (putative lipid II flippase)